MMFKQCFNIRDSFLDNYMFLFSFVVVCFLYKVCKTSSQKT